MLGLCISLIVSSIIIFAGLNEIAEAISKKNK